VQPDTTLRVAFLTTIVAEKEPIEVAERTLAAAREIVYGGTFDVWLLDEGDSDDVKQMCGQLGSPVVSGMGSWRRVGRVGPKRAAVRPVACRSWT
jgi:cellulose synthase/poly-beta-1,6-N-acetylglucosamine synthase-like glycosyltransferase